MSKKVILSNYEAFSENMNFTCVFRIFLLFKCDELASRTSKDWNSSFFLLSCIETKYWLKPKSWQTNQFWILKEFPMNSQKIPLYPPKNSQDFENIQFRTSHLEAENPFGLVFHTINGCENILWQPSCFEIVSSFKKNFTPFYLYLLTL